MLPPKRVTTSLIDSNGSDLSISAHKVTFLIRKKKLYCLFLHFLYIKIFTILLAAHSSWSTPIVSNSLTIKSFSNFASCYSTFFTSKSSKLLRLHILIQIDHLQPIMSNTTTLCSLKMHYLHIYKHYFLKVLSKKRGNLG